MFYHHFEEIAMKNIRRLGLLFSEVSTYLQMRLHWMGDPRGGV